ncbi:hypothetical protein B0E50_03545 [Rhodanobacter sp. C01]|nr:hypothetical protein B0E50_03545 [Rhodanobacter sp. C01]
MPPEHATPAQRAYSKSRHERIGFIRYPATMHGFFTWMIRRERMHPFRLVTTKTGTTLVDRLYLPAQSL